MRRIIVVFLLLLFYPRIICSQTADDMSKIVIGVDFQDGISEETIQLKPLLEDKLVLFATQAGCSSFDNKSFFVSPNIIVNSADVAEGGLKNVYIVRGELYLTIQDRYSKTIFSSRSFPFNGTATKKDLAIKTGILNIKYENVSSVFSEAKTKILSYYQARKHLIFTRANTLVANGDFDGAIACLMMIPDDLTDIYEQALLKAQDVFEMRDEAVRLQLVAERESYNDSILTIANSYLAMHQPDAALSALSAYSPGEARQDATYRSYVSRAESIISAEEREVRRKEERAYQDERRREDRAYSEYQKQTAHQRDMDKQGMVLRRQVVSSSERVAHHKLRVEEQKVQALKQVACDYIRNNPNRVDYIRVRF